ncbi:MAG TPA: nickel-binding protein [Solirubrobacteraceae bacterium]|nr:nickel-binding protein [Solirubrobacteraceae bacterium]
MDTPTRYTVELRLPHAGWADVQELAARARAATDGGPVRFLRSIFVPEDDTCFFLYEGPSAESVRAAALKAQLGPRRVDPALTLGEETS